MGRLSKSFGLAAIGTTAVLSGCANVFYNSPYSPAQLAQAQSVVTATYLLPRDELLFACNLWRSNERQDGCISIVGDRIEIFLWENAYPEELTHQLGHVYHRVFEGGTARQARVHSYSNMRRWLWD